MWVAWTSPPIRVTAGIPPPHPIRFGVGWHDVQAKLEGEVVADVETNFCQRWNEAAGDNLVPLPSTVKDEMPAQVVRTIPKGFYTSFAANGEYGIRHAVLDGIRSARQFSYLENQYLWAPEVVDALCEAMDRNDPATFRIVVVLPARAYSGRYDNDDHVRKLYEYDAGRGNFTAYSLYGSGPGKSVSGYRYVPMYVHAKVAIVDDQWLLVGSANLNRRGLATDSEIGVQSVCPSVARSLRVSLWGDHLGMPIEETASTEVHELVDRVWVNRGREFAHAMKEGLPPTQGQVHPYSYGGTPASRLMDRFQSLTLEH